MLPAPKPHSRPSATHNAAFTSAEDEALVRRAYDLAVDRQAANLKIRGEAPGNMPPGM